MEIFRPTRDRLEAFFAKARYRIAVYSPWITKPGLEMIQSAQNLAELQLDIHMRLVEKDCREGITDVEALIALWDRCPKLRLFVSDHLHAKLYIVDDHEFILSTSNLTEAGWGKNYELAVLSDKGVKEVRKLLDGWEFQSYSLEQLKQFYCRLKRSMQEGNSADAEEDAVFVLTERPDYGPLR